MSTGVRQKPRIYVSDDRKRSDSMSTDSEPRNQLDFLLNDPKIPELEKVLQALEFLVPAKNKSQVYGLCRKIRARHEKPDEKLTKKIVHDSSDDESFRLKPPTKQPAPLFNIVFLSQQFNEVQGKKDLQGQVQKCFGNHDLLSKRVSTSDPRFMIAQLRPLDLNNVKKGLASGGMPVPLPQQFCLLEKKWALLCYKTMTFIDVPD